MAFGNWVLPPFRAVLHRNQRTTSNHQRPASRPHRRGRRCRRSRVGWLLPLPSKHVLTNVKDRTMRHWRHLGCFVRLPTHCLLARRWPAVMPQSRPCERAHALERCVLASRRSRAGWWCAPAWWARMAVRAGSPTRQRARRWRAGWPALPVRRRKRGSIRSRRFSSRRCFSR